jgi:protein tyrosine/serine phosphatase
LSVLALGTNLVAEPNALAAMRPVQWARPIDVVGVPKLHQVAINFYRSAQPDALGFKTLATKYGVKSVVSLRAFNADGPLVRGLDLRLVRYKIHTWHIEREDVVGTLRSLRKAMSEAPVLLHCQHGADRTGLITALYRILYDGWGKQAAIDEMLNGNFGYHAVWGNIPRYIQRVDVEQLRRDVEPP